MSSFSIPTSQDIYLEVNGKKLAVVESCRVQSSRESVYIEAFGETQPVGTVGGRVRHVIDLSKVYIIGGDEVDFYSLDDFNLVIVKPDRRIIFSGCKWSEIGEEISLSKPVVEAVTIVASQRMELQ